MAIPHNLHKGVIIRLDGQPYLVLDYWEARTGQRRPVLHVKVRDVLRGRVMERVLDDQTKADVIDSQNRLLQYLYSDQSTCHFMDGQTYDQIALPRELIGEGFPFLVEEAEYRVLFLEDRPVIVELPPSVNLEVVSTPPASNTSGNTYKAAKLKNGIEVQVPPFVKNGDMIRVSTESREYLGKANE
jgi:elongation factor P